MFELSKSCEIADLASYYERVFGLRYVGSFVDIGAYNGIDLSNTLPLAKNGWKGLCVEPNAESFAKLKSAYKNYNSVICNQLLVGRKGKGKLYLHHELSTTSDEILNILIRKEIMTGKEPFLELEKRPLDKVIESWGNNSIDVLNIDTNGTESEVLETFDINYWKPQMIILAHYKFLDIKYDTIPYMDEMYFTDYNYKIMYNDDKNIIYIQK